MDTTFAIIFLIVFFIGGCVSGKMQTSMETDKLKAQCELELPRNQQCIMYFKPEVSE